MAALVEAVDPVRRRGFDTAFRPGSDVEQFAHRRSDLQQRHPIPLGLGQLERRLEETQRVEVVMQLVLAHGGQRD
jgi:hypothetical protein